MITERHLLLNRIKYLAKQLLGLNKSFKQIEAQF